MIAAKEKTFSPSRQSTFSWSPRGTYVQAAATSNDCKLTTIANADPVVSRFTQNDFRARKSKKSPIGSTVKIQFTELIQNHQRPRENTRQNRLQLRRSRWAPEMSLYRGYFVPGAVDPRGLDFIALAHFNIVTVFGQSFYHYSLEYWECPCVNPDGVEVGTQIELPHSVQGDCSLLGTVELSTETWKVWGYNLDTDSWEETNRQVSVIVSGISNHGPIEAILPIFEDLDPAEVQKKWVEILEFAENYEWAEQQGFGGNFRNWSKSLYHRTGTNSRTFIRQAVSAVNIPWVEMNPGRRNHPGRDIPKLNLEPSWLFFDDTPPHEFISRAYTP